ncbi:NtaA/DmoA family FMN-dependent monooxygenase [Streptomyces sp. NPDC002680]|uniref:NtaA/DmoA family FMN-dependent monooxygenase n=1 Tax=Streptomyces sp. NPDC002680 TaxID=3364659 RepID=UPI0036CF3C71
MPAKKAVHLGVLGLAPGAHQAAWRHPDCDPRAHMDLGFFRRLVETAERAKFDFLFLADLLGPIGADHHTPEVFERTPYGLLEPMTLLAALSTYTRHLGLVATVSASVHGPYQIARVMGSLDLLSNGRAGWNVVTTQLRVQKSLTTAPLADKEAQYEHAREVVACAFDFWDGWHEDSFPRDKEDCRFVSMEGARPPSREGKYYRLSGPLNQPRPPQGRPVIVQAGMSDIGRSLAADIADVVFTVQPNLESAKLFYKDIKDRVARAGRDPETVRVLPGLSTYVGHTAEEARGLRERMMDCLDPRASIGEIRYISDIDLSGYDLDGPIPDLEPWRDKARNTGFFHAVQKIRTENPEMTVRGLLRHFSAGRGHPEVTGSAAEVADVIEQWVDEEACDGLLIQPPLLPDDFERFADLVVPELQRRGRFRTEYESETLRGNLGLPVPAR